MIKRFFKNRQYIGIQTHQRDSWGAWQDITSAKLFWGRPDSFYNDKIYEYTPIKWAELRDYINKEAHVLKREFAERPGLITSYPIWEH